MLGLRRPTFQAGDGTDPECQGLPRSGGGLAAHIPSGEGVGQRHRLDGERRGDAVGIERGDDVRGHAEYGEGRGRGRHGGTFGLQGKHRSVPREPPGTVENDAGGPEHSTGKPPPPMCRGHRPTPGDPLSHPPAKVSPWHWSPPPGLPPPASPRRWPPSPRAWRRWWPVSIPTPCSAPTPPPSTPPWPGWSGWSERPRCCSPPASPPRATGRPRATARPPRCWPTWRGSPPARPSAPSPPASSWPGCPAPRRPCAPDGCRDPRSPRSPRRPPSTPPASRTCWPGPRASRCGPPRSAACGPGPRRPAPTPWPPPGGSTPNATSPTGTTPRGRSASRARTPLSGERPCWPGSSPPPTVCATPDGRQPPR